MQTITFETDSYNERRYGKPWIAIADFSKGSKVNYKWVDWIGDSRNGGSGILTIEAEIGDIIAKGQRDNRKPRNSAPSFYAVTENGAEYIGDKGEAYKYYIKNKDKSHVRTRKDEFSGNVVVSISAREVRIWVCNEKGENIFRFKGTGKVIDQGKDIMILGNYKKEN